MGSQYAEWSQFTTYETDDVVQYAGQIYVATTVNRNTVPYPPNATWTNISPVNPGILAGYVKNPMDTPLLCFNPSQNIQHSIDDAAYVSASEIRTDQISLLPGSLENAIKIEDSIEMRTAQEIRAEQELQLRTTGANGYKFHNVQAGSHPDVLGYNPTTGEVVYQPSGGGGGGTLTGVGAGSGITVDNTNPAVPVVSNDGVLTVNSENGALTVAAGSGISVATVAGTITITNDAPSSGGTLTGVGAGSGITVDNSVPAVPVVANDGVLTVNSEKGALTIAAGTGIGVATVGSTITVSNTAPNFKPSFEYFVAKNGNDTTGDGSEENPYLTVQKAVQVAETVGGDAVVNIAAGTYSENVIIQTGYICLKGAISSPEAVNGTTISGLINIAIINGVSNLFGNQVILKGLFISGVVSDNTAAIEHTLVVEDCRIETGTGALDSNAVSALGTVADQRTFITNCRITQISTATTVNPLVFCSTGRLLIDACQLSVRTTSPIVGVSGTGVLTQLSQSLLESNNTTNALQPLVEISSSSTTPHNIALNSFVVASTTAKIQSSAIGFNRLTPGVSVGVILQNFFAIAGTVPATAVITKNGSTTLFLEMAGNRAATGTSAGITAGTTISVPSLVGETTPDVVSNWANYPAVANVDMATFDIDNAGAVGATSVATTDFITSDTTITGLDVVATNSLSVDGLSVKPVLDFTATNELFVAKNGDDTLGNGSKLQPFSTIQKAIDTSDLITPKTGVCVIQIANGEYNESIVIQGANGGWIQLNGSATSQNNTFGVVIRGSILIDLDAGVSDLINRQVIFSGLELDAVISNGSSVEHTVGIQNCRFYPSAASNGVAILDTSTKNRVLIDNCEYTYDFPNIGVPFNFAGESTISFSKCDIQSPNNASIIAVGGTSYLQRLENCYIQNQFVSPTSPLLNITSTSAQPHSIALNIFSIASGTGITTPAINTANGGTLLVLSNNFSLAGTNPTTGNVIQYSGTAPTLIYGANTAVPLYASEIQSGITLVPLTDVGATAGKFTTLSATSGTIASTTMTGNTLTTTGTGQGVATATVSNGATILNGRVNITGSASAIALNVNTGTLANNTIQMNTGRILGVNDMAIANTNGTTPLTITNSGDNPHIICNNATANPLIPVEINLVNGSTTLAYGNQGTDPRGAFFFFNGKDCIRIPSATQRIQMNYSPYSPTLAVSGAAGAWVAGTGAFTSGVPKLLGTQTITLSANNFPIIPGGFGTPFYMGVNGFLNTVVLTAGGGGGGSGGDNLIITATYTRTRGGITVGPYALFGCAYPITAQTTGAFYTPVNGVSYNEFAPLERITFTHGDIFTLNIFGTYTGGSPPSIATPGTGLAAVFSPFLI